MFLFFKTYPNKKKMKLEYVFKLEYVTYPKIRVWDGDNFYFKSISKLNEFDLEYFFLFKNIH